MKKIKGLLIPVKVSRKELEASERDFQKNFKPLINEMEKWRRESSNSPIRIA